MQTSPPNPPGDDEDEGGGGPVIIDPKRADPDAERASRLVAAIEAAVAIAQEPGGADGDAWIASIRLAESLMWAKRYRDGLAT